ncbi:MAG TPA: hypothetical protein VF411_11365 [Bacteroidia bacterium]
MGIVYLILNEGDDVPITTDLLTLHETSTKANSILKVGADKSRKRIAVAMYWKYKTNEALDGPKSVIHTAVIV